MDAPTITALFTGISMLISAIVGAYVLVINSRMKVVKDDVGAVKEGMGALKEDMGTLEENTNHKMDDTLEMAKKLYEELGAKRGRAEEKAEAAGSAVVVPHEEGVVKVEIVKVPEGKDE